MSHRKVNSQGSIPFSWEAKPGVSKAKNQDCPTEIGFPALNCPSQVYADSPKPKGLDNDDMKIPLPPCPILKPPSRSTSARGLRWQDHDPFLQAYKECTKSTSTLNVHSGKLASQNKKGAIGSKLKKSKFNMFSCKSSCDVKDENFVQISQLPPLPRDRSRSSR